MRSDAEHLCHVPLRGFVQLQKSIFGLYPPGCGRCLQKCSLLLWLERDDVALRSFCRMQLSWDNPMQHSHFKRTVLSIWKMIASHRYVGHRDGLTLSQVPPPMSPGLVLPSTTATPGRHGSPWLCFWLSSQEEQLGAVKSERTLHIYFLCRTCQSPNGASYTAGRASFSKGSASSPAWLCQPPSMGSCQQAVPLVASGERPALARAAVLSLALCSEAERDPSLCLSL